MTEHIYNNPVDALNDYLARNSPACPRAIWLQVGFLGYDSRWDESVRPWTFGQRAAQGGCGIIPVNPGNALYTFLSRYVTQSRLGPEILVDPFYRIGLYRYYAADSRQMVKFGTTNAREFPRHIRKHIGDMFGANFLISCSGDDLWTRATHVIANPTRVAFLKKAARLARVHNINLRTWLSRAGYIRLSSDSSYLEYTDIPGFARSEMSFVSALVTEGLLVPTSDAVRVIRICTDCRNIMFHEVCPCRKIKFFNTARDFKFYGKATPKIPRHVGVELEIGNINYSPVKSIGRTVDILDRVGVSGKPDGSLGRDGMEFVTMPVAGATAEKTIITLTRQLAKFGDKESYRAGTHVHVDIRDLKTDAQLHNLLFNWDSWEKKIFETLPVARRTNRYCKPNRYLETLRGRGDVSCAECGESDPDTSYDEECDEERTMCCDAETVGGGSAINSRSYARISGFARDYIEGIGVNDRYRALNLQAYSSHKTVEFRFLESTLDGRRIVAAATFLSNLVNDSLAMKEFTPGSINNHAKAAFEYLSTSIPT